MSLSRRDLRLFSLFFALPALLFFFPFLLGKTHYAGDVLYSFQPWLTYAAGQIQSGHLPLWNPYSACGEPFLANPQVMAFYPGAQLFWLFSFPAAWRLFLVANQFLLFGAAYLLASFFFQKRQARVITALAAAWGGAVTVMWEFPSAAATLPWVVLVYLLTLARGWKILPLAVAFLFLAGYTPYAPYALLLSGFTIAALCLFPGGNSFSRVSYPASRVFLPWLFAVAAGLLLALPQILPAWETAGQSLRSALSAGEARRYLLTPVFFVKFLLPTLFDKVALAFSTPAFGAEFWPVQRNWLNTFFIGTAPLLLSLAALSGIRKPRVLGWALLVLLAACVSTGTEPFLGLLRLAPGQKYMTHFSNIMLLAVLGLSLLAGESAETGFSPRRALGALWGCSLAATLALLFSAALRTHLLSALLGVTSLTAAQHQHVAGAALSGTLALLLAGGLLLAPSPWRGFLLALFLAGELYCFGGNLHPTARGAFFHRPVALAEMQEKNRCRLAANPQTLIDPPPMAGNSLEEGAQSLRQILRPSVPLPFRLHSAWGYDVFPLRSFAEFRRTINLASPLGPQMNFAGAKFILSTTPLEAPAALLLRSANALLYDNPGALPRVSWVNRAQVIPERARRLAFISGPWRPEREVVLEQGLPSAAPREGAAAPLEWGDDVPGRMTVRGEGNGGYAVWSQVFYPGWEVYVNGQKRDLLRANHAFQAVETPPGFWRAVFIYRPKLFRWGLLISLSVLLFWLAGAVRAVTKRPEVF